MSKTIEFYLTIDSGNSGSRFCLFDDVGKLIHGPSINILEIAERFAINKENTIAGFVSVTDQSAAVEQFETHHASDYFKEGFFLNMPVNYSETLGVDRLVLAYLFYDMEKTYALIDSGTFTTVDLVTKEGFCGGHILPGLGLLAKAYDHGKLLQGLVSDPPELKESPCPKNSKEAVSSGLSHSFFSPLDSILSGWDYDELQITGGNGKILDNHFKNTIFQRSASIHFSDDLIHRALFKFLRRVTSY